MALLAAKEFGRAAFTCKVWGCDIILNNHFLPKTKKELAWHVKSSLEP